MATLIAKNAKGEFILSETDIMGEVKNFFIAGHETTGNAITWALYCLTQHPHVMSTLVSEIDETLGSSLPDGENVEKLHYLDCVIQETLRLYPPIWIFPRKLLAPDELCEQQIPKNAIVNILPYLMHRHPKYWRQAELFYPERFSESHTRPKCAYIPFGFGPRVCIGRQFSILSIKIVLTMLLQRFHLKLPEHHPRVLPLPLITLKPNRDICLELTPRSPGEIIS